MQISVHSQKPLAYATLHSPGSTTVSCYCVECLYGVPIVLWDIEEACVPAAALYYQEMQWEEVRSAIVLLSGLV